jgi:hypothetical protein
MGYGGTILIPGPHTGNNTQYNCKIIGLTLFYQQEHKRAQEKDSTMNMNQESNRL